MTDINTVYSGGSQNTTPQASLGGFPSPAAIEDTKNNLFDDITSQETTQGVIDHRCVYVFNDSDNVKCEITIYIEYLTEVGATVQLGFLFKNEVQSVSFPTTPAGGSFKITTQGLTSDAITWVNDTTALALNIENAIKTVTDCSVSAPTAGIHTYHITFKGVLGNKALSTLTVTENTTGVTPTTARVTAGSPINTIAPDIGEEKVAPTGIVFYTILSPGTLIGTLYPAEGFPVWIRRNLVADTEPVEEDGFKLQIKSVGELIP